MGFEQLLLQQGILFRREGKTNIHRTSYMPFQSLDFLQGHLKDILLYMLYISQDIYSHQQLLERQRGYW